MLRFVNDESFMQQATEEERRVVMAEVQRLRTLRIFAEDFTSYRFYTILTHGYDLPKLLEFLKNEDKENLYPTS